MGYFPFFVDIKGKSGLIIGGGRIASHKVEKLLPFEPELTVIAPEIVPELLENPALDCKVRAFRKEDLEGRLFVVAASDDKELNQYAAKLCREKNILVNVVDEREECGFIFPSLVKEGKLTVGISTEGASPRIAADIRSKIAQELPDHMEQILDYLMQLRIQAKGRILEAGKRTGVLKEAARLCMERNRPLSEEETEQLFEDCQRNNGRGSVILVGAGCGSYDLITIKGLNAVKRAQVLVYDDLIDERLLSHAAESCEKIYVGKRNGKHSMAQEEINALLIQKAGEGKQVVRLKGGDPFVFGRGGEEILALKEAEIEVSEVPGITSAIAVPALAGIPVTQRKTGRSFHVITGHTAEQGEEFPEDLESLAALNGTLVFLMGFAHLKEICEKLVSHGKNPETPVAVVQGKPDGNTFAIRGTLTDIAEKVIQSDMTTPAVIIIGENAGMDLFGSV